MACKESGFLCGENFLALVRGQNIMDEKMQNIMRKG